ncbi:CDP-diacylglycerol pyrophosphatase [Bradyrhizobium sp. AZCC 2230]
MSGVRKSLSLSLSLSLRRAARAPYLKVSGSIVRGDYPCHLSINAQDNNLHKTKKILSYTGAAAIVSLAAICAWFYVARNRNALWEIVSEQCVPKAQRGAANNPCAKVDLNGEYVIFKDRIGVGQYLLIPTKRIKGIETPELVEGGEHNYWRDAWNERAYVDHALRLQLVSENIGLAVNSASGRSQDQLHIHIDCMRPDVVAALRVNRDAISGRWTEFPSLLSRHQYRTLLISVGTLRDIDPFRLLYSYLRGKGEAMADQSLLLTGTTLADGKPGFILLNTHVGPGGDASAEELLDHSCSLSKSHNPE